MNTKLKYVRKYHKDHGESRPRLVCEGDAWPASLTDRQEDLVRFFGITTDETDSGLFTCIVLRKEAYDAEEDGGWNVIRERLVFLPKKGTLYLAIVELLLKEDTWKERYDSYWGRYGDPVNLETGRISRPSDISGTQTYAWTIYRRGAQQRISGRIRQQSREIDRSIILYPDNTVKAGQRVDYRKEPLIERWQRDQE